jgi:hypothetical protein
MLIVLRNEAGETIEESFNDIEDAAQWCCKYPDYGIFLYPENDEEQEWNPRIWQDYLDYFMGQ